ncbi:MAG: ComEC/Rec2 family competence protein [Candidatus Nomurabacteria bacterium]|nr:ComEC/Rec2 family competence protein [Candidatus Saccharibacteria bacterium]USN95174.1 MAG: ComEC/Rec2 family competence protein [Candidatus Nomurabacteria bacterium]
MVGKYRIRQTTMISCGLILFLAGLILARFISWAELVIIVSILIIATFILLPKHRKCYWITLGLIVCLLIGYFRGVSYSYQVNKYDDLYRKQVSLIVVAREDAIYSERKQLIFSSNKIETTNGHKLVGNIEVEGFGLPMVYKGDKVLVEGKLYPRRGDNVAGISFAKISLVSSGINKIDQLRRNFATGLQNVLPEPLASLGLGILIGQRSGIPKDLTEQLREVGLIHIVAVSGYNLTIIVYFAQRLLQKRSRFQATIIPGMLVVVFLLITGFSPSIIRASVVSFISLFMWYFGRQIRPILLILLSAVVTAGWNPLYIWSSVGWYLSFSAFFGILILSPLILSNFFSPKHNEKLIPQLISETISAQICTIPILLYVFHSFSVVSLLANILVVPLIPFVMMATLVSGLYGMISPIMFFGLIVLPAKIMLQYIVEIAELLSRLSFASFEVWITIPQTVILVTLIILFTTLLYNRYSKKLTIKRSSSIV